MREEGLELDVSPRFGSLCATLETSAALSKPQNKAYGSDGGATHQIVIHVDIGRTRYERSSLHQTREAPERFRFLVNLRQDGREQVRHALQQRHIVTLSENKGASRVLRREFAVRVERKFLSHILDFQEANTVRVSF